MGPSCQYQPLVAVRAPMSEAIVHVARMKEAHRLELRIATVLRSAPNEETAAVGLAMAIDALAEADPVAGERILNMVASVYQRLAGAPMEAANDG